MKNKIQKVFHLSWLQSLVFLIAFISSLASSPLALQARSSVNNTAHLNDQFSKASFPLLGQNLLRQSDNKNAAVYDNYDDFKDLPNDNPPEPTNPSYREYQLKDLASGVNVNNPLSVHLISGKSLTGSDINLPNLTANDLSTLKKSNINIDSSSKLQGTDLAQLDYNPATQNLNIRLTETSVMKTNGAGTQLVLNIQSPNNVRKDQIVIGIWRNYVQHPSGEIDLGNKLHLQYMSNNDSTWPNNDKESSQTPTDDTTLMYAIPNFRIRDESQSSIIDTMYTGNWIINYPNYSNLWVGTEPSPHYKKPEQEINPVNHSYVNIDPQDSNTILFQFDSTPTLTIDNVSRKCRLRVLSKLEKSSTGQYVVVKQQFINYTVDKNNQPVNLPPVWFYRRCDTQLDNHDDVPVFFRELNADGIPRGLYLKNVPTKEKPIQDPYRLDFLFDVPDGPDGWMGGFFNNDMTNFIGQRDTNQTPDSQAYPRAGATGYVDSMIAMIWAPSKIGALAFGQSSPTIGFETSSGAATAPTIRSDKEKLKYCYDTDKGEDLPPVKLSGTVNSTNEKVNYVKLYYLIDNPTIPTADTQRKSLGQVQINEHEHELTSWAKFDNLQITDEDDLKTLATRESQGHSIYIYGIDDQGYQSNIVEIKVLPNVNMTIHYKCGNDPIKSDNYFLKAEGDSYNLNDTDYAPNSVVSNGIHYKLSPNQTNLSGTVTTGLKEITIQYDVADGMAITQVPKLDFGKILLLPKPKYYNIVTQTDDLQIKATNSLAWKLSMSADPFYLVTENNQLDKADSLDGLLYYHRLNKDSVLPNNPVPINTEPKEVSNSVDVASASETLGNTTTTNFRNVWWERDQDKHLKQVSGPLLLPPSSLRHPQATYHSTVTWTLDNVPN